MGISKEPTDKNKYKSRYSKGGYITAAQFILEIICEKKAKADGIDLPTYFWRDPKWMKYYSSQLRRCHALLKKYDDRAIVKALRDQRVRTVYSLHAQWLVPVIEEYDQKIKSQKTTIQNEIDRDTISAKPRPHRQRGDTTIARLKELENE